jgi:hypothetical protein
MLKIVLLIAGLILFSISVGKFLKHNRHKYKLTKGARL